MNTVIESRLSRRKFLATTSALGAFILYANAAQMHRIGFIGATSRPEPGMAKVIDALFDGLREQGYIEGKNLVVERRYTEGQSTRFAELAAEVVRLNVDLIVVFTTPAALAVKAATNTIPVVIPTANDPVGAGLAKSLAHPGGNITGLAALSPDLSTKRLELLKEVVPRASRVAVLYNAANPANLLVLRQTEEAARHLGMRLQPQEIRSSQDLDVAFGSILHGHADALIVPGDQLTLQHTQKIAQFTLQARLPAMFETREMAVAGGLMSYGPSYVDMARRASVYVDKILKGANPADLPFEQASKFELVINKKTARHLGLAFPQSVLVRADE